MTANQQNPARTIGSAVAAMFLAGLCLTAAAGPAKASTGTTISSIVRAA